MNDPSEPNAAEAESPPGPKSIGAILYVDDDPAVLELTARQLEMIGYRASKARTSARALELFAAGDLRFDAVLTDFSMPGMNGLELAKRLHGIHPDVPIALFTGSVDRLDLKQLAAAGVRLVLQKPVPMNQLETAIGSLLLGARPR